MAESNMRPSPPLPTTTTTARKRDEGTSTAQSSIGFLEELEIAKALSLETLELDRIRRRRYFLEMTTSPTNASQNADVVTRVKDKSSPSSRFAGRSLPVASSVTVTSNSSNCKRRGVDEERGCIVTKRSENVTRLSDTRSRPRPSRLIGGGGGGGGGDVLKTLPPPPRKNSAPSEVIYSDLMSFAGVDNATDMKNASSTATAKSSSSSDLEALLDMATEPQQKRSTDLFNLPLFNTTVPVDLKLLQSCPTTSNIQVPVNFGLNPLLIMSSGGIGGCTSSGQSAIVSAKMPSSASSCAALNQCTFSNFPLSQPASVVSTFGTPPTAWPPPPPRSTPVETLTNFNNRSAASAGYNLQLTASTWNQSGTSTMMIGPAAASATQQPSSSSSSSVDVLKVIEKKANENLIDLSYFDTVVMWGSASSSSSKTKNDLLKTFDPLLDVSDESASADEESTSIENKVDAADRVESPPPPVIPLRQHSTKPTVTFADQETVCGGSSDHSDVVLRRRPRDKNSKTVLPSSRVVSYKRRCSRVYESIQILSSNKCSSQEIEAFRDSLVRLRREFVCDDYHTNVGFVISPTLESLREETLSVRLVVHSIYTEKPISFVCDVATSVEHAISQAVCTIFDDIRNINLDSYVLKVHGMAAYLSADSCLVDYEYVHQCHKFDEDVRLTLLDTSRLLRPLARTAQDDAVISDLRVSSLLPACGMKVSQKTLSILSDTLEGEITRLTDQASKGYSFVLQPKRVIQAVKALCSTLANVETKEIMEAIEDIQQVTLVFARQPLDDDAQPSCFGDQALLSDVGARSISKLSKLLPNSPSVRMELLKIALQRINETIRSLLDMFCQGFQLDFKIPQTQITPTQSIKDITTFLDTVLLHVASVHRLTPQWAAGFEYFVVDCELYHGTRLLCDSVETRPALVSTSFYELIVFDEWLEIKGVLLCLLPREARLCCVLYGVKTVAADSKQSSSETGGSSQQIREPLGWATIQLFDHNGALSQGSSLCGMWSSDMDRRLGPAVSNVEDLHCPVMQINLPDFGSVVLFPPVIDNCPSQRKDFESLASGEQQRLLNFVEKSSPLCNVLEEREALWDKRHYLYDIPQALPKVLLAAYSWDWACLADIYAMLQQWKPMDPLDALELLLPCFPDVEVRKMAISWIKDMGSDELCDYLPQLVQALKYETYLDSSTAWFLIERSLTSIRFMHHLYWLLKQNLDDVRSGRRILLVLNSLLAIAGKSIRNQMEGQEKLMDNLSRIAEKMKSTKDSFRLSILHNELESTHYLLDDMSTCLPLSPSMEVCGLNIKMCSYYTSRTLPLKLNFRSVESHAEPIEALFKEGDDLRQDMITLQMIRIMDKLWLKEGLDLKVITFACVPTANKKGIVEMIKGAETLRKIQTEHGLTGSFKDHPIAEWLQRHNPSELEYLQAVENFTLSCAGYSVATYILGICDRHNDNIMLKTSGHIFHIDFGKFLGDSQMFGSIKRDRVPFVLTSDMAYVINVGDKPSSKFHNFVDLCCQAFNVVRRHGSLFLHLFALMVSSGIPGLTTEAVGYVQRALLLEMSDSEAAVHFSRMIEDSMKSWFTQLNFFMHNLAQLRFNGEQSSETLLSFVPKSYTMESDGKIRSLDVVAYQKRYEPEKVYMYILAVRRMGKADTTYLFRSYRELCEFHQKLCSMFPLAKYKSLSRSLYLGRSNIRQVAEKRKDEIKNFLKSLWKTADEIKHCDLVYTFFHPLLRDQHEDLLHLSKVKEVVVERPEAFSEEGSRGMISGQLKLSLHYKEDTFFVMICHARNLSEVKGQTPDPYVKTYLIPDPTKATKRKTKVVRKNNHPTFMEMLIYRLPLQTIRQRILHVSVWDYDRMTENAFLGSTSLRLANLDLTKETTSWYSLENDVG